LKLWLSNNRLRHPLFFPLLLVAAIFAVYYPTLSAGIHTVDDPGIVSLYSACPPLSQVLLPGNSYYYRPLLELSYWLDNLLWGMEAAVMHLESVLLHCANALLVFLLARRMTGGAGNFSLVPLLAALFFAMHPVNVESVAWIAGRTDPLLALFALSACLFWLRWLEELRPRDLCLALLLFAAALLVKETALAAVAAALLLSLGWPGRAGVRERASVLVALLAVGMAAVFYAISVRGGVSGLTRFMDGADIEPARWVRDVLVAYGFYARKLAFPLPLNFTITDVHPMHALAGAVLAPAVWLFYRCSRQAALLLACAALLTAPAVMVAVVRVAWTPYAERYLYLPSAFFAIGLAAFAPALSERLRRAMVALLLPICLVFALLTLQRAALWSDKLAFVQDQIRKSPGFGSPYNELGALLFHRGEIERAERAFVTADRLNQRQSMRLPIKANLMGVRLAKGDYSGVRSAFLLLFKDKSEAPAEFLELLQKADSGRMYALSGARKAALAEDILETLELLYQKRQDPFWLYRSGQIVLAAGDAPRAAVFFRRSYLAAPADAHYREAAATQARKLGEPR